MTVLVVDDSPDMRAYLARCLGGLGPVVEAADGLEALAVLDETEVGLVVSDVVMPRMGGYALCRALRRAGGPPLLLVSGETVPREPLGDRCAFLPKPFNARGLLGATQGLLGTLSPPQEARDSPPPLPP